MLVQLLKMMQVACKLNQQDLAEAMGVHPAYLSTALRAGKITDSMLRKIAKTLNVSSSLVFLAAMNPPKEFNPSLVPAFLEVQNQAKRLLLKTAGEIVWKKKPHVISP